MDDLQPPETLKVIQALEGMGEYEGTEEAFQMASVPLVQDALECNYADAIQCIQRLAQAGYIDFKITDGGELTPGKPIEYGRWYWYVPHPDTP